MGIFSSLMGGSKKNLNKPSPTKEKTKIIQASEIDTH